MKHDEEIAQALRAMGLLRAGDGFTATPLLGGVSCDVWRVDLASGRMCVKRALPKLRVEADWRAPPERAATEVAWLKLAGTIVPGSAPAVLGEAPGQHMFAMEFLPPERHPVWKTLLAQGIADAGVASRVGETLARIHAATAGRHDITRAFSTQTQFHALRLEPYLLHTANRHPDVGARIRAVAQSVADARIALMHGDISPKNILVGPNGPVFLDAETACYGDPAFDLAFCLNHLLLKCVWHPDRAQAYVESFEALRSAYRRGVNWEEPAAPDMRAAALLGTLLLARIDGKSPVEYLTGEGDKDFVRQTARWLLAAKGLTLDDARDAWRAALARRR